MSGENSPIFFDVSKRENIKNVSNSEWTKRTVKIPLGSFEKLNRVYYSFINKIIYLA